jgi:DNA-binding MarR family transcriptional regulator
MDEKLSNYFNSLRKFSNVFLNELMDNGNATNCELNLSQMKAISAFKDDRPFLMKELASNCGAKISNMTTMVDRLIAEGFAERKRDGADRRKVFVSLTTRGKKIRAQFLKNRRKAAQAIFSKLGEKDKKALLHSLDKVCTILEKSITSDGCH